MSAASRGVRALGALICTLPCVAHGQRAIDNVVPRPVRVVASQDAPAFMLRSPVRILVPAASVPWRELGEQLAASIRSRTGYTTTVSTAGVATRGTISLMVTDHRSVGGAGTTNVHSAEARSADAYSLDVDTLGVRIAGAAATGARWGAETLLQLLEHATLPSHMASQATWQIAALHVEDAPRFAWRGSMLDVSRHFLPVRDIERHIDLLSRFKMNVLHWHLTDDQGWRIEIKRYPRLTSVGAWRREADGSRSGGYYTQAQIRHIVNYARRRGVSVVPEIEMPGHSSAAIAAYPFLGCTNTPLAVPATWGVFADIYCAGKEQTFAFLFGVLDEVMALFPSPVIHVGGDEVPKDRWKACASCQAVMQREKLANEDALQSWFLRRVAAHVAQRGRRIVGWDEVLDGPYVAGGIVQSWRDSSFTRVAVMRGHDVIASPSDFTYLNRSPAELTVADVAGFNPMPLGLDSALSQRVLGAEVPFWSEHIVSGANLELMAIPRLLAFAEVLWSGAPRDLRDIQRRLSEFQLPALRAAGYAVGPSDHGFGDMHVAYDAAALRPTWRVVSLADGIVVRGTTDGSRPTALSPLYADGSALGQSGGAQSVARLQMFWGPSRVREEMRVGMVQHAGVGAHVQTTPAADARYPGTGVANMADGMVGSMEHGDGLWQGWWRPDVVVDMELRAPSTVARIAVNFLQNVRSWILLPAEVTFRWSADGGTWSTPIAVTHDVPVNREGVVVHTFAANVASPAAVRFIRVSARASGALPIGHPGAGQPAWLFADEVIVRARRAQP